MSAAKSACSACSSPAGACIWRTSRSPKATSSAKWVRSAFDPEQLLDTEPERLRELDRQRRRRREHAVFDGVHGLPRDADLLGKLGLGEAELGSPFLQPVGEAFRHYGARAAPAGPSGSALRECRRS